jgi:hypothetical protein
MAGCIAVSEIGAYAGIRDELLANSDESGLRTDMSLEGLHSWLLGTEPLQLLSLDCVTLPDDYLNSTCGCTLL